MAKYRIRTAYTLYEDKLENFIYSNPWHTKVRATKITKEKCALASSIVMAALIDAKIKEVDKNKEPDYD